MKYIVQPFFILCLAGCCLFSSGCIDDDDQGGTGTPTEPFTCAFGFDVNAADEECNCPEPKVSIGDETCRELEPEEFYSDMEGCLLDIGMIFYFEDDTVINNCCRTIQIESPRSNVSRTLYGPVSGRQTRLENGMDSIAFEAGSGKYFVPDPTGGEFDLETRFRGIFIDEFTIEGTFEWGPAFYQQIVVLTHPGIFRRRVE
jgi:hypothetical protein